MEKMKNTTKTLYKLAKQGVIDINKLRRRDKITRRVITKQEVKLIHVKQFMKEYKKYPNAKTSIEYGHFEGDTIVGKNLEISYSYFSRKSIQNICIT